MSNITLKVNSRTQTLDIEPATPLLYILRNGVGLQGLRFEGNVVAGVRAQLSVSRQSALW